MVATFALNIPGLFLAILGYQIVIHYSGDQTKKIMIAVQYASLALLAAATYSIGQGIVSAYPSLLLIVFTIIFFIACLSLTYHQAGDFLFLL